ncbi:MAG TPA: enoyl-CoA hydratase/isomerase family protein [Dehalococcoidia bacterium]|nr:enoyl-CoA hydratase/isomerase family protein [Dehalococcoidia bacterium]
MTTYEHLLIADRNGVRTITLNRPEKLNALGAGMPDQLRAAVKEAIADNQVRVIVITGSGRAFSAGGDIRGWEGLFGNPMALKSYLAARHEIVLDLQRCAKPSIAAVNGDAVGGGCGLALSCDIRLAAETARLGFSFARLGLVPDWGSTYYLPRLVGTARACELVFTADLIGAQEAERIGLVNHVYPAAELPERTRELAEKLAGNGPIGIGLAKQAIYRSWHLDLAAELDGEENNQAITFQTQDVQEGIKAFFEKRRPVFKAR